MVEQIALDVYDQAKKVTKDVEIVIIGAKEWDGMRQLQISLQSCGMMCSGLVMQEVKPCTGAECILPEW